jgi:hypothetical protein
MENQEIVQLKFDELKNGKASKLIEEYQSFDVVDVNDNMKETVTVLEDLIEKIKMTCRVYTAGIGAAVLAWGITGLVGTASTVAIAAHNLATLNLDYEIAKNKITGILTVIAKNSRLSSHIVKKIVLTEGERILAILKNSGFLGCMENAEENLSENYKQQYCFNG